LPLKDAREDHVAFICFTRVLFACFLRASIREVAPASSQPDHVINVDPTFTLLVDSGLVRLLGIVCSTRLLRLLVLNDRIPVAESTVPSIMGDATMDIDTANCVTTIAANTDTDTRDSKQRELRRRQAKRAEQQGEKRARNKVIQARYREEQDAYVQEVLQQKRLEDMLTDMGGLVLAVGDASKLAEGMTGSRHLLEMAH
jgi:hypothetical protein